MMQQVPNWQKQYRLTVNPFVQFAEENREVAPVKQKPNMNIKC
jgi:hypothetical protein